jgi:hypothetical protein
MSLFNNGLFAYIYFFLIFVVLKKQLNIELDGNFRKNYCRIAFGYW